MLQPISLTLAALILILVVKHIRYVRTNPLRKFNGPKSGGFLFGNIKDTLLTGYAQEWMKKYGRVFGYAGILGETRFFIADTKAIAHILHQATVYPKPDGVRYNLSQIVGPGVLVVEGEQHKRQRKVMNPAFGNAYIKELTPAFLEKSIQLRDIWAQECISTVDGIYRTDGIEWMAKLTLDIIGSTGFNYSFNSLGSKVESDELQRALGVMMSPNAAMINIVKGNFPLLRLVPTPQEKVMDQARKTMNSIGTGLFAESKEFLRASGEKDNWRSRDMSSLLLRANTSSSIPENQRMTDDEVLAQVPTFFVAGHETTATTMAWTFFALTQHPDIQRKLREELLSLGTEDPSLDELNSLPYLDAVVREVLRLHSPVPFTLRVATKDDILPLRTPVTDAEGNVHDSIPIRKGDMIDIPLLAMNTDPAIWGEDALEFKPERWEKTPAEVSALPGVWGNIMSFLGGARACIGYRFSLAETKSIIYVLLRSFEFELAIPHDDLVSRASIVQRPYLRSDPGAGAKLPILIRPVVNV
ncbi:cytochrome P450 [Cylindrobasidium torrendii FP15055 ss-10]|uniref:Cytochrome P450 n=1 Tax=Cylindrobasidium torrendii FP15055 ss-10 TaxID=1314674 RepID=A0A0D7B6E1_9AGAR|nr:cytochrome P450 [Cylindrobasidium torrendii FP15055 ss-10]